MLVKQRWNYTNKMVISKIEPKQHFCIKSKIIHNLVYKHVVMIKMRIVIYLCLSLDELWKRRKIKFVVIYITNKLTNINLVLIFHVKHE